MRHIPNILSCIRLLMIGIFIYFFVKLQYLASLIVFIIAFLTDVLDGYLARRNNWVSDIGKVLDPLADKLMLITALTCCYLKGWLPLWILAVAVIKELIMIIAGIVLFKKDVVVYSDWFGKIAAGCFNVGVALTLLKVFFPAIGMVNILILAVAILLALIAMLHYAKAQVFVKR